METVTTRIPEELKQMLDRIQDEEGVRKSEILRRIIEKGISDWRKDKALEELENHSVTVRKAAEIAGVSYTRMFELASEKGIDIGYTIEDLEEDMEKV